MKSELLLYVGAGTLIGSAVLGLAVGLIFLLRAKIQEFRYGVFYSVFALVASIGYCLASIAFYFNFLAPKIAVFCSLIALGFVVGLSLMAMLVKKTSRVLFVVLSFYSLLVVWLAPLFLWNIVYIAFVARRTRPEKPEAVQTTTE